MELFIPAVLSKHRRPAVLMLLTLLLPLTARAAVTDVNLRLGLTTVPTQFTLNWFASNAAAYQLESSLTLTSWANFGPAVTGRGSILFVTNAMTGTTAGFFRVKQLLPTEVITATFAQLTGILTVSGDALPNIITVSRDLAGNLLVNDGAVPILGGNPTVANTTLIQIFGGEGEDQLTLNEANGALPKAQLLGEAGHDTLTGGSGNDILNGGPGNDSLFGKGGADSLLGGDDDDTISGGDGDDAAQLGAGNDRFIWNPGDDTDVVDGGDGVDTVEVNGGNGAEQFTTTANGTRVRFDRINPAPFSIDIGTCEKLVVNANGGNDSFSASGNLAALIQITVDGGSGDDTILGSNGADLLLGGNDNDFIDGNQGADTILAGAGNDVIQWDPGDGSDVVEGQEGNDTLLFNGANVAEIFDLAANGSRVRFTRNVAAIVMDLDGIETLDLNLLGGADQLTVNNLAGTALSNVIADLAASGGVGDAAADNVIVAGTTNDDTVVVNSTTNQVVVNGLTPLVTITGSESANDRLTINLLAGEDVLDASSLLAGFIILIGDGGTEDDVLLGSAGTDTLLGGDGDDVLIGGPGPDVLDGGPGNNVLIQD